MDDKLFYRFLSFILILYGQLDSLVFADESKPQFNLTTSAMPLSPGILSEINTELVDAEVLINGVPIAWNTRRASINYSETNQKTGKSKKVDLELSDVPKGTKAINNLLREGRNEIEMTIIPLRYNGMSIASYLKEGTARYSKSSVGAHFALVKMSRSEPFKNVYSLYKNSFATSTAEEPVLSVPDGGSVLARLDWNYKVPGDLEKKHVLKTTFNLTKENFVFSRLQETEIDILPQGILGQIFLNGQELLNTQGYQNFPRDMIYKNVTHHTPRSWLPALKKGTNLLIFKPSENQPFLSEKARLTVTIKAKLPYTPQDSLSGDWTMMKGFTIFQKVIDQSTIKTLAGKDLEFHFIN